MPDRERMPVIAANDGPGQVPMRFTGEPFEHVSDLTPEEAADGAYPADEPEVLDLGRRHFVAPYGAGFTWWHDCTAEVEHVSWGWFGPVAPDRVSGHRIASRDPLTVEGSLVCNDCGDHGFIRESKWVPA